MESMHKPRCHWTLRLLGPLSLHRSTTSQRYTPKKQHCRGCGDSIGQSDFRHTNPFPFSYWGITPRQTLITGREECQLPRRGPRLFLGHVRHVWPSSRSRQLSTEVERFFRGSSPRTALCAIVDARRTDEKCSSLRRAGWRHTSRKYSHRQC